MRKLNADPDFKARHAEAAAERMRKLNADPDFKAATAERMRKLHADPDFKAATAERMRKLHADPDFKARHAPLANLTDEQRKLYQKLRSAGGLSRAEALAEVQRPAISRPREAAPSRP